VADTAMLDVGKPALEVPADAGIERATGENRQAPQAGFADSLVAGHAPVKRRNRKQSEAMKKLDRLGIEWYCEQIISGENMTSVARAAGVSNSALYRWLQADTRRANASREAREYSAEAFVDKAEQAILGAASKLDLLKARELAFHYRWKASKIAPRDFGDRLQPAGDVTVRDELEELEGARRLAFVLARASVALKQQKADGK